MIVQDVLELQPHKFSRNRYDAGLAEFRNCIESVDADGLISWYRTNGRESDKSISKAVNALILENLKTASWETNWSFCPSVSSNHATFEASKKFGSPNQIRFAMDIASRHSNEALGYLVKGQLARKRAGSANIRDVDAHILLAYTESCLEWGKWNGAVYSYEKLISNVPLVIQSIRTPVWIFAVREPNNLKVSHTLAQTLKLEKLDS